MDNTPPPSMLTLSRQNTSSEVRTSFNNSYANFLVILVPIGIVAGALNLAPAAVFILNFLAVVPFAPFITMAGIRLSGDARSIRGGLLKIILGNAVELMICVISLAYGDIRLVQAVILGSVLSYSLLVLGGSLLYASYDQTDIRFSRTQTSVMLSLVIVVSITMAVPTTVALTGPQGQRDDHEIDKDVLNLSRGIANVILVLFGAYLIFRYKSHPQLFPHPITCTTSIVQFPLGFVPGLGSLSLSVFGALIFAAICINYIVRSVDDTIKILHLTKSFIGVVLLPLIGNAAKVATIVKISRTRSLDYPMRAIMSNILDTLLFITPFMVLLGWVINQPMDLDFGFFDLTVFLVAMILLTCLLRSGKSTYFEGAMLMGTYLTIAASFYMRPEAQEEPFAWRLME